MSDKTDTPETDRFMSYGWCNIKGDYIPKGECVTADKYDKLERERDELLRIITDFCYGQNFADQRWKDQSHIKPLFQVIEKQ